VLPDWGLFFVLLLIYHFVIFMIRVKKFAILLSVSISISILLGLSGIPGPESLRTDAPQEPSLIVKPEVTQDVNLRIAVALKSAKDTAWDRVPMQVLTFLQASMPKGVEMNWLAIGDKPNVRVGNVEIIDVNSHLYDNITVDIVKRGDNVIVNNNSDGWKNDQLKFLPGFKKLYERFPGHDWYIMIDDDTYVFWDNLVRKLKTYNSSLPWYLGRAHSFVGCDGVTKHGKGPSFAHGGSGFAVSAAALDRLLVQIPMGPSKTMRPKIDRCIWKYRDCWAGDIRMALCLRDVGVLITNVEEFAGDVPGSESDFPKDPCFQPLAFHHLNAKGMQKMYELERSVDGTGAISIENVLHRYVLPSISQSHSYEMQRNTDRPGNDFNELKNVASVAECKSECANTKHCLAWTYQVESKTCWLKDTLMMKPKKLKGFYSGVALHNYQCTRYEIN
jgi:hypothetical protein